MLEKLSDVFSLPDWEWKIQTCGQGKKGPWAQCVPYITARAIMDRLDAVVGPMNWRAEFRDSAAAGLAAGVICRLTLTVDGVEAWKEDGAQQTEIEAFKGGLSNSLKRAAVHWGIGRFLYEMPVMFAECSAEKQEGMQRGRLAAKDGGGVFWWRPPLREAQRWLDRYLAERSGVPQSRRNEPHQAAPTSNAEIAPPAPEKPVPVAVDGQPSAGYAAAAKMLAECPNYESLGDLSLRIQRSEKLTSEEKQSLNALASERRTALAPGSGQQQEPAELSLQG